MRYRKKQHSPQPEGQVGPAQPWSLLRPLCHCPQHGPWAPERGPPRAGLCRRPCAARRDLSLHRRSLPVALLCPLLPSLLRGICLLLLCPRIFISYSLLPLGLSFWFFLFVLCFGFFFCFSPPSPGCPAPPPPAAAADEAARVAPQPPLTPSFSAAVLRAPLPSLPCLFSPPCLSYSLLSASLGATRGLAHPISSPPSFPPVTATPTPVKSDAPLVQDAAGNSHMSSPLLSVTLAEPRGHGPGPDPFLWSAGSRTGPLCTPHSAARAKTREPGPCPKDSSSQLLLSTGQARTSLPGLPGVHPSSGTGQSPKMAMPTPPP